MSVNECDLAYYLGQLPCELCAFLDNFGLLLKLPTLLETFVHTYAILFKARVGVNVHLSKAYKGFFANKLYQVLRPIEKNDDFT